MLRPANIRLFFNRHPQALAIPFIFVIGILMLMTVWSPELTYSTRYPNQQTYLKYTSRSEVYNISVIADKDKLSKTGTIWESVLKSGYLTRDADTGLYDISWDEETPLRGKINEEGRGMELSDLTYWNGQLWSFDDRTGVVYAVDAAHERVISKFILADGNGHSAKGFKCEWSTVKDNVLYVGGLGKEWSKPDGEIINQDPQWVKTITPDGRVAHVNWAKVFTDLRKATGTEHPGYLIHEAVRFNPVNRRWYFLPRRVSKEQYDDTKDESRGSNLMISTDEYFKDIKVTEVGPKIPTHGFSAFVFVPYRETEVVALKSEEFEGSISTYITVFTLDGKVLMEETKIGDVKFEGVEIL
eukprot:TRINITY_DN2883_c0_g1_i1.p1 TRINITY_DN2883_c0_g1~~TRINITY_DN2883_c0_g1_i1.p1  ORF type:complete len:356 (-),score=68.27 TRINITY_DN2883_c0_g1_i1:39-1106(-)